jgi:hypothetical protein
VTDRLELADIMDPRFDPANSPARQPKQSLSIRNDDLAHHKSVILGYRLTVPPKGANDWRVRLNDGITEVRLAPGQRREIPVEIVPGPSANQAGQHYTVDVFGLSRHELVNSHNKNDVHNEFRYIGGARIEALIVLPTRLSCGASSKSKGSISVVGRVRFGTGAKELDRNLPIMAIGWNSSRGFIESSRVFVAPDRAGQFRASLRGNGNDAIERVDCMFAGTTEVSSALRRTRIVRR